MDLSKVSLGLSTRGGDMLCVDNFLYHFDGRANSNTFSWTCKYRCYKPFLCRSRILTVSTNQSDLRDQFVVNVFSEHTHPRCNENDIAKVLNRTRTTNHGFPSKFSRKRRYPKRCALALKEIKLHDVIDFDNKDLVQILRRKSGRFMCCVNGQVYFLDSKSSKTNVFRWICVRKRDINCKSVVYTEPTIMGAHRLRSMGTDMHKHEDYSPSKLKHMFAKRNITIIDEEIVKEMMDNCIIELSDEEKHDDNQKVYEKSKDGVNVKAARKKKAKLVQNVANNNHEPSKSEEKKMIKLISPENTKVEHCVANETVQSSLNHNDAEIEILHIALNASPTAEVKVTQALKSECEMDLTKIWMLHSAQGKKALFVDGYIYLVKSSGVYRTYWVCAKSRELNVRCRSRVSTATQDDGSIHVLRVFNQHTHPADEMAVKHRLYNEICRKNKKKNTITLSDFIDKSLDEINFEYGDKTIKRVKVSKISQDVLVHKPSKCNSMRITPDDDDDGYMLKNEGHTAS